MVYLGLLTQFFTSKYTMYTKLKSFLSASKCSKILPCSLNFTMYLYTKNYWVSHLALTKLFFTMVDKLLPFAQKILSRPKENQKYIITKTLKMIYNLRRLKQKRKLYPSLLLICTQDQLVIVNTHSTTAKKGKKIGIQFYTAFFLVHIPLLYQISTHASFYTRFFNFSHSCDFHIPFLHQNCHIATSYQNFLHIPAVYQSVKAPSFVFCHDQTFSWRYWSSILDTSECVSMIIIHLFNILQNVYESMQIFQVNYVDIIPISGHEYTIYIFGMMLVA